MLRVEIIVTEMKVMESLTKLAVMCTARQIVSKKTIKKIIADIYLLNKRRQIA